MQEQGRTQQDVNQDAFTQVMIQNMESLHSKFDSMGEKFHDTLVEFSGISRRIDSALEKVTEEAKSNVEQDKRLERLEVLWSNTKTAVAVFSTVWAIIGTVSVFAFKAYMTNSEQRVVNASVNATMARIDERYDLKFESANKK